MLISAQKYILCQMCSQICVNRNHPSEYEREWRTEKKIESGSQALLKKIGSA